MSGKRKPFPHSPKDSSSSDEDNSTTERSSSRKGDFAKKQDILTTTSPACADSDVYDDNVASPSGSSTASGPVYVRPPGYKYHGQEITVKGLPGKGKKKKAHLSTDTEVLKSKYPIPSFGSLKSKVSSSFTEFSASLGSPSNARVANVLLKPKTKREPLPMKLRALPQSFWQQPNLPIDVSPGQIYAKLPPLISKDAQDVTDIRPVSPPADPNRKVKDTEATKRTVKVSNTDWLYKLFNGLDGSPKIPSIKRGRPKKVPSTFYSQVLRNDDPCLSSSSAEIPLPSLSHEKMHHFPTLTMISLRDRDKSVSLPALHVEPGKFIEKGISRASKSDGDSENMNSDG